MMGGGEVGGWATSLEKLYISARAQFDSRLFTGANHSYDGEYTEDFTGSTKSDTALHPNNVGRDENYY